MMKIVLKLILSIQCFALVLATSSQAAFPDRPVHLVIGSAPGGGSDTMARIVAQKMTEIWGQPVIVESKPGAAGAISADYVARVAPDGYTLLFAASHFTIAPSVQKLTYDTINSFVPVTEVAHVPSMLIVQKSFPANTLQDLIKLAREKPNSLNFGEVGKDDPTYLSTALLMQRTGIKMIPVPYKGGGEITVAVLKGEVQMGFLIMSTGIPGVKAGNFKALAISVKDRSPAMPEVPTVAEAANLPGFDADNWLGILAPAGTPPDIVSKMNRDFVTGITSPDTVKHMGDLGWAPVADKPEEYAATIKNEVATWGKLIKSFDVGN